MTREKEIDIAASRYIEENTINGYITISDHKDSFIEGAKWADSNSKSPWINVNDDLPCNHDELKPNSYATYKVIVLLNDGRIRETYMFYDKWVQYGKKITHWKPFIEPPKE